jgi:hypothetical protein
MPIAIGISWLLVITLYPLILLLPGFSGIGSTVAARKKEHGAGYFPERYRAVGKAAGAKNEGAFGQDVLLISQPDFYLAAEVVRVTVITPEETDYLIEVMTVGYLYIGGRRAVFIHHPDGIEMEGPFYYRVVQGQHVGAGGIIAGLPLVLESFYKTGRRRCPGVDIFGDDVFGVLFNGHVKSSCILRG